MKYFFLRLTTLSEWILKTERDTARFLIFRRLSTIVSNYSHVLYRKISREAKSSQTQNNPSVPEDQIKKKSAAVHV